MSGRLIILGKKGYCPWNSKNLSRIRRDEEEHRQAELREQGRQADKASKLRLGALKKVGNEEGAVQQRFSLFEAEERASLERSNEVQASKSKIPRNEGRTLKNESKNPHQFIRFGGNSFAKHGKRNEFYLKPCSIKESLGNKELQIRRRMDPMLEFQEAHEGVRGISSKEMAQSEDSDSDVGRFIGVKNRRPSTQHMSSDDSSLRRGDKFTEGRKDKHRENKRRRREKTRSHERGKSGASRKRRKSNRSSSSRSNSTDSIEELRRKRSEREREERRRQDSLFVSSQQKNLR